MRSLYESRPVRRLRTLASPLRRGAAALAARTPFTRQSRARRWVRDEYMGLAWENMNRLFLSIARFAHINRPIDGYYFEFGCHEARTIRLAWQHFQHLFHWDFVAFDSFEGLPEIDEIDRQEIWQKGRLKTDEREFIRLATSTGMPRERLHTVRGFYDDSLTPELQRSLLPRKAAVVYVDCDLYKSTVPVLEFVRPFLQRGTIVVFDDWNCFCGDPARGERRAWGEFRAAYPELRFEAFVSTNEAQSFICVDPGPEAKDLDGETERLEER